MEIHPFSSFLKCCICSAYPPEQVNMCENKLICQQCSGASPNCQVCNKAHTAIPNLGVRGVLEIVDSIHVKCPFTFGGLSCPDMAPWNIIQPHKAICAFRPARCFRCCDVTLVPLDEFEYHIKQHDRDIARRPGSIFREPRWESRVGRGFLSSGYGSHSPRRDSHLGSRNMRPGNPPPIESVKLDVGIGKEFGHFCTLNGILNSKCMQLFNVNNSAFLVMMLREPNDTVICWVAMIGTESEALQMKFRLTPILKCTPGIGKEVHAHGINTAPMEFRETEDVLKITLREEAGWDKRNNSKCEEADGYHHWRFHQGVSQGSSSTKWGRFGKNICRRPPEG